MKKIRFLFVGIFLFLMLPSWAFCVPNLISYQGVLNDSGGVPVSATVNMTFKIYDAETGGNLLWNETQSVQISNGVFNVQLGSVQALTSTVFQTNTLYLGIQVGADAEMVPRQHLTSGFYAQKAATVDVPVPIGAIMAWAKSISGIPALPDGWVECNGQALTDADSPLNGQTVPNLNGENRFLYGDSVSNNVKTEDYLPSHGHQIRVAPYNSNFPLEIYGNVNVNSFKWAPNGSSECNGTVACRSKGTPWQGFSVVWIMKIK